MEKSPNVKNSAIRLMIVTFLAIENNDFPGDRGLALPNRLPKQNKLFNFYAILVNNFIFKVFFYGKKSAYKR